MGISQVRRGGWVGLINACALIAIGVVTGDEVLADPFSATFTSRESKRVTAIAATAPFDRTYAALTEDSKDLTFQESTSGRTFLAFSSLDGALDNLATNYCSSNSKFQIYWVDKYQDLPAVCLSRSLSIVGAGGDDDSTRPQIGGAGRDEGRYIAYESDAQDLLQFVPTATPTETPTPTPTFTGTPSPPPDTPTPPPTATPSFARHQVAVHDRKWGVSFPSASKCDVVGTAVKGANRSLYLWQMSDDGSQILLSSQASNIRDNLAPKCQDGNSTADVFVRDGTNCVSNIRGACNTSVLFDTYGYHADPNLKETLDEDSQNVQMTQDKSVVVFDTVSTNPMYFSPDTKGFKDIYYHTNSAFQRITQAMVPFCSSTGTLLPLTNEFGPAEGDSEKPSVDATGRYVAFESAATDLVVWEGNPAMQCSTLGAPHPVGIQYIQNNGFGQIYLYDHLNKKIELVSSQYRSSNSTRQQGGNGNSTNARISRDGRFIVFESTATNLLSTATTSVKNIFTYDRFLEQTYLVTTGTGGTGFNKNATLSHISLTGLTVAFQTKATNVVVEGPSQGTTVSGSPALCSGNTETCAQHIYLARHNCPLDTDGDLVPDCLDGCKNDLNKTEPMLCGCGVTESDTDNDFSPDCIDACDIDSAKTAPGACGCGFLDTDTDGDSSADCLDSCPTDVGKSAPGVCGCGVTDVDTDADGSYDCNDSCPTDPAKSGAGGCPCGTLKDIPGLCGCNVADVDTNGNGQADCLDPTQATEPSAVGYNISKINLGKGKSYNIIRVKMQAFGGKNIYSYSLTKKGYKLQKTSASASISINGIKAGTYTFTYSITTGKGSGKITTKKRSTTIKVS